MNQDKYKKMFQLLGKWVRLNECGITVGTFLKEKQVKKVGIYGFGTLGKHLLFELKQVGIEVVYGIDKRCDTLDIDVCWGDWSDKKSLQQVDLLIVTAISDYDMIEKEVCEECEYPLISIEDIIVEMERMVNT